MLMNIYQKKPMLIRHCFVSLSISLLFIACSFPLETKAQAGVNMSNPIIMGNYNAGTYTYSDSRNNSTYGNDYGQASPDIYYEFTVNGVTTLSISTCGSGWDTYLSLIDHNGVQQAYNDDNGGACTGTTASIVIPSSQTTTTSLEAGTYYIIAEGYGTGTGVINLSVSLTVQNPVVYNTKNFIKVWDANAPETDPNTLMTRSLRDVKLSSTYFDGLGRPEQTVIKKGSLSSFGNTDLVSPIVYDQFGREAQKYLPYVASTSDGQYKTDPLTDQNSFYTGSSSPISGQGETFFYGKTDFEPSPLNRPVKTYAPGNNWVGAGRGVEAKYWINTSADSVRKWTVTDGTLGTFGTYTSPGAYAAGKLYKNITVDENQKQVIEFKDKEGKIILKKVQFSAAADNGTGSGHAGWLCTYYIYDDLGNLRCVIQPRGVELISSLSWALTDPTILAEQCFRYEYDQRNRIILKKVAGAGIVNMVYDTRDRLVMTQDANLLAQGKWMVTKYDDLNRVTESGLWTNSTTASAHRTTALTVYPYPSISGTYEILSVTHYDDYAGVPTPLTAALNSAYINSPTFLTTYNASPDYARPITQSSQTIGMVTWTQAKVLGTTSQFISEVNFYDDKERLIQTQTVNQTGGIDIATTQYDFAGKVLRSHLLEQKAGTPIQTYQLATKNTYDDLGRLIKIEKNMNNAGYKIISSLEYDALGQLKKKSFGAAPLETLSFDYNIRGWLLGMNRDYLRDQSASGYSDRYFGFELGYDKYTSVVSTGGGGFSATQYNGNITGTIWKSRGDQVRRKYDFQYDNVNRFGKATFTQNINAGSGGTWNATEADYSVHGFDADNNWMMKYDANGNILSMIEHGFKIGSPAAYIDALRYEYSLNSNKLKRVTDDYNDKDSKLGDFKYDPATKGATDYSYDANGNLVVDNNKKISSITYNYLNLPSVITVTGKGTITYIYDATGNKLKKVTQENNVTVPYNGVNYTSNITTTTNYISGFVYETKEYSNTSLASLQYTDVLQFAPHEEGRIRTKTDGTFAYDYFIKDHLGNVRMVLTDEQKTNYYPAATVEGTFDATTNSMVNYEKNFYRIDNTKITPESQIPSWVTPAETLANTKLYYNNNSSPSSNVTPITPPNLSYPTGCAPTQTTGSSKLYMLNATTNRTGLEFMIKVMAGDHIDIFGKSYYLNTASITNDNSTPLDVLSLMTNMLLSPGNAAAAKGITNNQLNTINNGVIPSSFFRGKNSEQPTTIPKAYINYIFLDEQFKYAGGGASRVGASSGVVKDHWQTDPQLQNITVPKNGYIFVYVSNESNFNVFFDNLQVIHKPGPILEETHYYPFGLTMAGISSKALNGAPENKIKLFGKELQNKEFADGSGLEWYDYGMREYDQQLGRFFRVDPITERFYELSPYQYCFNNPIKNVDLDGLEGLNFNIFNKLIENTVKNPNGTSAKVLGTVTGIGGAVTNVVTGTANAFRHPIQTGKGLMHVLSQTPEQNAADYAVNVTSQYVGTGSDAFTNYAIVAHVLTDIGIALSPMKEFIPAGGKSIWELAPSARGFAAEKILGGNLPAAFPVIDKFVDGVATSIKSIDLTAASYNKGNGLLNTLKGYVNKLDNFNGKTFDGVTVNGSDITSKVLDVAVQPGKASLSQWEQIAKAMQYAKDNNIQFNLQFIK